MFKKLLRPVRRLLRRSPNAFLGKSRGVIHIGANDGEERTLYSSFGLPVVWVEPIPGVFGTLAANIAPFANQRAVNCLISDEDDKILELHIANNHGASSSILDFKRHGEIWPEIHFVGSISLQSITLSTLLAREHIDTTIYNTLILDTQGSELMILSGSASVLKDFLFIKVEVPNFEAYANCCTVTEMAAFMKKHGFREHSRDDFARTANGGFYYDIVYRNGVL
jgi:FkbM family methyltransferase